MPPAVLLPRPSAPDHRAPAAPLPCLQPQDHRGHRLSRGAFHRHRHHHRLLLHVLLLLLVPAPAAPPHAPPRPGNSAVQLQPCSSSSSLPRGPQSRPYTSPAWLHPHGHVSPSRPCRPVPHVPLRPPCLQPYSTTTLCPGTAQLPWSMSPRGDLRTVRRPVGPGGDTRDSSWRWGAALAGTGWGSSQPSWGDPVPAGQGGPCAAHWALCWCLLPRLWVPVAPSTRGGVPGGSSEGHAPLSPCTLPPDLPPALPSGAGIKPRLVPTAWCLLGDSNGEKKEGKRPQTLPAHCNGGKHEFRPVPSAPETSPSQNCVGTGNPHQISRLDEPTWNAATHPAPSLKKECETTPGISGEKTANSEPGLGLWAREQFLYPCPLPWTGISGGGWVIIVPGGIHPCQHCWLNVGPESISPGEKPY